MTKCRGDVMSAVGVAASEFGKWSTQGGNDEGELERLVRELNVVVTHIWNTPELSEYVIRSVGEWTGYGSSGAPMLCGQVDSSGVGQHRVGLVAYLIGDEIDPVAPHPDWKANPTSPQFHRHKVSPQIGRAHV